MRLCIFHRISCGLDPALLRTLSALLIVLRDLLLPLMVSNLHRRFLQRFLGLVILHTQGLARHFFRLHHRLGRRKIHHHSVQDAFLRRIVQRRIILNHNTFSTQRSDGSTNNIIVGIIGHTSIKSNYFKLNEN